MPRSVTLGMCVSWEKGETVEKTETVLFLMYYSCLKRLYKHFLPWTFFFFFLLCGCISLHASPRGSLTETKECVYLCVRPICICTVFVRQIGNDSQWFAPEPKASIAILELHPSHLYLSLVGPPVDSHTHPSSPLHWFFTSLPCAVSSSSTYLKVTQCCAPL